MYYNPFYDSPTDVSLQSIEKPSLLSDTSISVEYSLISKTVRSKGNTFTVLIAIAEWISQFSVQETEVILEIFEQEGTCHRDFGT